MQLEHMITVTDAAERLGLKHGAVRRAIDRGDLPALKVCSRIRIDPAELSAWLEEQRIAGRSTP